MRQRRSIDVTPALLIRRPHRWRDPVLSTVAALVLISTMTLLAACGGADTFGVDDDAGTAAADWSYVIPAGAGDALDAGTPLSILPAELNATVGETIQIVNEDDRGHLVGPWFVGANETLRQRFASAGEFIGECTVHPSGLIKVLISEADEL